MHIIRAILLTFSQTARDPYQAAECANHGICVQPVVAQDDNKFDVS